MALWRSPWRPRLDGLDACRRAADDMVRHLNRAGYQLDPGEGLRPHGGLAGPDGSTRPSTGSTDDGGDPSG